MEFLDHTAALSLARSNYFLMQTVRQCTIYWGDNRMDTIFYLQGQRHLPNASKLLAEAWNGKTWRLDLQLFFKVPAQEFSWCFIIEKRSLSFGLFNHLAHQDVMEILFQNFYYFNGSQEKLKVSAFTWSLPECFETGWQVMSLEELSTFKMWQATFFFRQDTFWDIHNKIFPNYFRLSPL